MYMARVLFVLFLMSFSTYVNSFEIITNTKRTKNVGYGCSEKSINGEQLLMERILKPCQVVFDVGANVGEWSLSALEIEPSISLSSFEPIPKIFEQLKGNLDQYINVKSQNTALSDDIGKETFYFYEDQHSTSELSSFFYREVLKNLIHEPVIISVEKDTLSNFCSNNAVEKIDFLKIDTEGCEWKVLQGARDLIRDHKISAIQFEYGGCYIDSKTTLKQVYEFLTQNDYKIYRIMPKGLIQIDAWNPQLENYQMSNYFAVYKDDVERVLY